MWIFLIRHWKVKNNINGVLNWWETDQDLSKQWLKEFDDIKFVDQIQKLNLDIIFTSSLKRAVQTAYKCNEILSNNINITIDSRLNEQYFGDFAWCKIETIKNMYNIQDYKSLAFLYRNNNWSWESWDQFTSRIKSFFDEIFCDDKNVLVVAHGGVYKAYLYLYQNLSIDEVFTKNCSIKNLELVKL